MPTLSKPLVVPQFGKYNTDYSQAIPPLTINLFEAGSVTPEDLSSIDLTVISQELGFGYPNYIPSPNVCLAIGIDLYVSISAIAGVGENSPCAAILKFAGYFTGDNTTATAQASAFTTAGNAYCGLAFDGIGTIYAATTDPGSKSGDCYAIYAFPIDVSGGGGTAIYNDAGANSDFGDLAFDGAGNLWVADYNGNRVLVFPAATLGNTNGFTIIANGSGPFPVVNTDAALIAASSHVFTSPEGVGFDGSGNLWVGNNNDGYDTAGLSNDLTSLVQITPGLQTSIVGMATAAGATLVLEPAQALTLGQVKSTAPPAGFAIYQVPTPNPPYRPQFGGLQIDALGAADLASGTPQYLYVNDEVYAAVRQFDINPASAGFIAGLTVSDDTALTLRDAANDPVVTNPGNGGIALVLASLVIGDGPADTGVEPDGTLPVDGANHAIFWESPNIGVGTSAAPPPPPFTNYESIYVPVVGAEVYVYVNVTNIGCTPTTGSERLRIYWASGATTQSWPQSWTEITVPPGVAVQTSGGQPLAPGQSTTMSIPWPTSAIPPGLSNTHYCLLARIETAPTYPFGMTYWEDRTPGDANMGQNVVRNSKIAQVNIYIGPSSKITRWPIGRPRPLNLVLQIGNIKPVSTKIRIGFQLLDPAGVAVDFAGSHLAVHAPPARETFLERLRELLDLVEDGIFHVARPEQGLGHFSLAPHETIPLTIAFTPPEHLQAFALRALQHDEVDGQSHLVGGQTFAFGTVAGISGVG